MLLHRADLLGCNFNPRSHEGSDCANNSLLCSPGHFNPRSHEGSDQAERLKVRQYWYFNPCSHEGSDDILLEFASSMLLFQSTLPRGERQIQVLFPDQIVHFNPRSHEGSDICQPASALPNPISIHAPTRGATFCSNFFPPYEKFQSTLPRGERQKCRHQSKMSGNFNPRSHEGSDKNADTNPKCPGISIHAPTRGATCEVVNICK